MKLSIIIPAYNEQKTIGEVLKNVQEVSIPGIQKEIIIVDDGSQDDTVKIVSAAIKNNKNALLIQHEKNSGKGKAVQTGLASATGDIILIQDADLEYHPKDIPKLIYPIVKGERAVVYGTRLRKSPVLFGENKTPLLLHFFGNKFLSLLTTVMYGQTISDMETGYKVFSKKSLEGIVLKSKTFDFEPEITAKILKKGIKILELDIDVTPRDYSEGKKLHPVKDGIKALTALVKYRLIN